jgi:CheY-like chemotaxis protein
LRQIIETDPQLKVSAEASDGEQALARLQDTPVDAAMLDLTMPLKDGFAVARAARELRLTVPLVFLTMHKDEYYLHWHIALDDIVEFGQLPGRSVAASLLGSVTVDNQKVGEFLATITDDSLTTGTAEFFLFDGDGEVVGRIALEPRRSSEQDLRREREQREAWASHHKKALAMHLGSEIVRQMSGLRN